MFGKAGGAGAHGLDGVPAAQGAEQVMHAVHFELRRLVHAREEREFRRAITDWEMERYFEII